MAKTKKTKTKKATAKKPATKKTAAKKPAAKKTAAAKATAKKPAVRRPDSNLPPSPTVVREITDEILELVERLDNYSADLRALDRKRHNAVGLRRIGFIEAALRISWDYPQYFPHWLNFDKFNDDFQLFNQVRSLVIACRSLEEKAWNINVEAADMVYTDALEYYSQVQDAARRRIDPAETIYAELNTFFRHGARETDEPTEKQIKRDVDALLHGRKDGEVIIKNISPKTTRGKHEVIDETFKTSARFKDTAEGSITE